MKPYRYYFHQQVAEQALEAVQKGAESVRLSLDLNISEKKWPIKAARLILNGADSADSDQLAHVSGAKNKVFAWDGERMIPLEVRERGYYKLVPTSTAPTLEIDGVKMHRSKDIDPLVDAELKTRLVVKAGDRVLDTCGGLGYSAAFALKAGAREVISFEKSRAVIQLRNVSPWTEQYADARLILTRGDITAQIKELESAVFNSVIHDPPRFTSATGDLYGKLFYDELFRVMAHGGRLFHYTGSPKKIKSQDRFINNTIKRLENSGFGAVQFHDNLQGIYAKKN